MSDPRDHHISFFQWNCAKRRITESFLPQTEDTVIFLQEPHLTNGQPFSLSKRKFYKSPNGRVAIYVPRLRVSSFIDIPELVKDDMVAGLLQWGDQQVVVASLYMHKELPNPVHSQNLESLIRYCNRNNRPLICGTDSNSWHELWFSQGPRGGQPQWKRGDDLVNFFQH